MRKKTKQNDKQTVANEKKKKKTRKKKKTEQLRLELGLPVFKAILYAIEPRMKTQWPVSKILFKAYFFGETAPVNVVRMLVEP